MANCVSCSAPLPGVSSVCEYCGRRNDVDLHGIHKYTEVRPDSERTCPRCEVALHTINLKNDGKFYIERCEHCMGLFFDSGELEALLEQSVSHVFEIDRKRLNEINRELYRCDSGEHGSAQAFYIKCPVCREFMQRKNFGARSGVIADRCMAHGVWLDGGELKRLMEWKKAGGQLLHEQMSQQSEASQKRTRRENRRSDHSIDLLGGSPRSIDIWSQDDDLVSTVFKLVDRLF